jgi:hypothetical protein
VEARRLEASGIIATAEGLAARITDRFPDRGITVVADDLAELSRETEARLAQSTRPNWGLRALAGALIVLGLVVVALAVSQVRHDGDIVGLEEWLSVIQNGIQDVVFLGIAVAFLLTIEARLRRRTMLAALHELRSVAHVIDMHQLTKDPDSARRPDLATEHSPKRTLDRFELSRYLDYCSEMLSVTTKLAALYAQESDDPLVLGAVREIEGMAGALSSKIWQKIMIIDVLEDAALDGHPSTHGAT